VTRKAQGGDVCGGGFTKLGKNSTLDDAKQCLVWPGFLSPKGGNPLKRPLVKNADVPVPVNIL